MSKKNEWLEIVKIFLDEVSKTMGYRACPKCGQLLKSKFCTICGFQMPLPQYKVIGKLKVIKESECPKCHRRYDKGELFCGDCGEKLLETTP